MLPASYTILLRYSIFFHEFLKKCMIMFFYSHRMLKCCKVHNESWVWNFYETWNQIQSFIVDVFMVIGYSIMNTLQMFLMSILIHNLFKDVHCIFSPFHMVYICNLNLNITN